MLVACTIILNYLRENRDGVNYFELNQIAEQAQRRVKEQLNKRQQQLQQQQQQTQNKHQKQQQTNETSNTNVWKTNWTKESFIQKLVEKIAQCSAAINSEETKEDQWDLAKELTAVGVSPEQDFIGEVLGGRTFEKILIWCINYTYKRSRSILSFWHKI